MGIRTRVGNAAKALFGSPAPASAPGGNVIATGAEMPRNGMVWPVWYNQWLGGMADSGLNTVSPGVFGMLPGATTDFAREAGELWNNGVVGTATAWLATNFAEPTLVLSTRGDRKDEPIDGWESHPAIQLIETPNGFDDQANFFGAVVLSLVCDGNAYIHKVRSRAGKVVELWWLPHWAVRPRWPTDGSAFISFYEYMVAGRFFRIDNEDIIHIRQGRNPDNQRIGLCRLKAQLRSIVGDNEGEGYDVAILKNAGVAPHIAIPEAGKEFFPDDAVEMRNLWRANQGGDQRGSLAVASQGVRIERLGFSPQELAIDKLRAMPAARILAALGLNAMALGLPDNDRTYANYGEAIKAAFRSGLTPLQSLVARALTEQLLPEFDPTGTLKFAFDYSMVHALQEDQDAVSERVVTQWTNDLIDRAEARRKLGHDPVEGDEGLLFSDLQGQKAAAAAGYMQDSVGPPPDEPDPEADPAADPASKSLGMHGNPNHDDHGHFTSAGNDHGPGHGPGKHAKRHRKPKHAKGGHPKGSVAHAEHAFDEARSRYHAARDKHLADHPEMTLAEHHKLMKPHRAALTRAKNNLRKAEASASSATSSAITPHDFDGHGGTQRFAEAVHTASATAPPSAKFGDDKVFVADLHEHAARTGAVVGMPLDQFKHRLTDANREGHLELARADLVEAMDKGKVAASEIDHLGATFHFVRIPRH